VRKAGRKERHGQSRRNESGLLLRRVSKFPTRAAEGWQRLGVGGGRERWGWYEISLGCVSADKRREAVRADKGDRG